MKRRLVQFVLPVLALLAVVGVAQAFYHSSGGGNGSGSVGTLNGPTNVQANSPIGTDRVDVSWSASSTSGGGVGPDGYRVSRSHGSTTTFVCGTSATATIPGTSCSDTTLADGDYTYTVTAVYRSWSSAATSNKATVTSPSITLSRTSGNVASSVAISGSNFPANGAVSATYGGNAVPLSPSTSTNGSGSFSSASFNVPESSAGAHTVQVAVGGRSASSNFTVTPSITLTPTRGPGGSTDQISGKGFAASSAISATFNGSAVTLSPTTSDTNGSFSAASYSVPDIATGSYSVTASDGSNHSASASFLIDPHVYSFDVAGVPASATAGSAMTNVTITAKKDGATETSYAGSKTLNWSGGSNSPSGATPTYQSNPVTFTGGQANVSVTLVKAGNETVNVSEGTGATQHAGSFSRTVNPAAASRIGWSGASASAGTLTPNPCLFSCNVAALGNNQTFTSAVSLHDAFGNLVTNAGAPINVAISAPGAATPAPTSPLTIATGASTSSGSTTVKSSNGSWTTLTVTASSSGLTSATTTLNKN